MKKEYLKPQILVVHVRQHLMETISQGDPHDPWGAKRIDFEDDFDSDDSPKNLWDDYD